LCSVCWDRAERTRFFSFWRTRRLPQPQPARIDAGVVMDLFERVHGGGGPDRPDMAFVLALYLTRRKALKLVGLRRDADREMLRFRRPGSEDELLVENPGLEEDQIEATTAELKELLQGRL
jgi:hypothetical protein